MTSHSILRKAALFALCFTIASCTNLSEVNSWSQISLEATQYNQVVSTYADTPRRLARYDHFLPAENDWLAQADIRDAQAESLKQLLSVVSDYMSALEALSTDTTPTTTQDVKTLNDSFGRLNTALPANKQVSKATLNAAGSILQTVLDASKKAYQAKQIALVIESANPNLQTILGEQGDLYKIVNEDFRRDLELESLKQNSHYRDFKADGNLIGDKSDKKSKDNNPLPKCVEKMVGPCEIDKSQKPSRAAVEALEEWQAIRKSENAKRKHVLEVYLSVLKNVAKGHQKLYDNRNKLGSKKFANELAPLVISLRKQVTILATFN